MTRFVFDPRWIVLALLTPLTAIGQEGEPITQPYMTAGGAHNCAVTAAGVAYCWGSNNFGELGDGTNTNSAVPVTVSGMLTFQSVSADLFHSCGVTSAGVAYCWGINNFGQLGDGTTIARTVPAVVSGGIRFQSVSAGGAQSCGLTTTGAAYCWGMNLSGRLGHGSTDTGITWQSVRAGLADPPTSLVPVAVSGGLTFQSVTAGNVHNCGVTTTGAAYCWGSNFAGQLGDGTTTDRNVPVAVVGGLTFQSVSPGVLLTCGVTTAGAAYCWGWNHWEGPNPGVGQLGDGTATDRADPVAVSGGQTFQSVSAGSTHSCGVTPAGSAYCWGNNGFGQLGDGTTTDRDTPVAISGGYTFQSVSAGEQHSCGVTTAGAAYCWGRNHWDPADPVGAQGGFGQLGDGTNADSPVPVLVGLHLAQESLASAAPSV